VLQTLVEKGKSSLGYVTLIGSEQPQKVSDRVYLALALARSFLKTFRLSSVPQTLQTAQAYLGGYFLKQAGQKRIQSNSYEIPKVANGVQLSFKRSATFWIA